MIKQQVYVIMSDNAPNIPNGTPTIEVSEEGNLPALLIDYEDGNKYLAVVTRAIEMDFLKNRISFELEQFMWNTKFGRWDKTIANAFNDSKLGITNEFLVRASDGKWKELLTEEELLACGVGTVIIENGEEPVEPTDSLVGEYDYWLSTLGKNIIFAGLLNAIQTKFEIANPEPEVEE